MNNQQVPDSSHRSNPDAVRGPWELAKAFTMANRHVLAGELKGWRETGKLVQGKLHELAQLLEQVDSRDSLALAESLVVSEAIAFTAGAPAPSDISAAGWAMMSAYSLCPIEMSHPRRMEWMAKEFRRRTGSGN